MSWSFAIPNFPLNSFKNSNLLFSPMAFLLIDSKFQGFEKPGAKKMTGSIKKMPTNFLNMYNTS
jgi:hypothetical protein